MRTVYVYVLRGQRSGGLEALHQLVHELTSLGIEARLVASPESRELPEEPAYAAYGASTPTRSRTHRTRSSWCPRWRSASWPTTRGRGR